MLLCKALSVYLRILCLALCCCGYPAYLYLNKKRGGSLEPGCLIELIRQLVAKIDLNAGSGKQKGIYVVLAILKVHVIKDS